MKLYHFTCIEHLPRILGASLLLPSESNIGSPCPEMPPMGERLGPDVVWLTNQPNTKHGCHGLLGPADKGRIRFTVELEDCPTWREFANQHGINRLWYRILDETGNYTAKYWYVYPKPIKRSQWIEVRDMLTNNTL